MTSAILVITLRCGPSRGNESHVRSVIWRIVQARVALLRIHPFPKTFLQELPFRVTVALKDLHDSIDKWACSKS